MVNLSFDVIQCLSHGFHRCHRDPGWAASHPMTKFIAGLHHQVLADMLIFNPKQDGPFSLF